MGVKACQVNCRWEVGVTQGQTSYYSGSTNCSLPSDNEVGVTTQRPSLNCFEDNTAYFGNNIGSPVGQKSRSACQQSCARNPKCLYWTYEKRSSGRCFLKTSRNGVTPGQTAYVSGSKNCILPVDNTWK